jgi:hypothetical protein
VAEVEVV